MTIVSLKNIFKVLISVQNCKDFATKNVVFIFGCTIEGNICSIEKVVQTFADGRRLVAKLVFSYPAWKDLYNRNTFFF